ncbi:unnamed protein product [Larinioides sclopetarius]|uniref:Uncharacterized protein n=1 Tax=Larinioides sclopetarius TaxID=280406 RepID=A0AAV1ZUY1_9ARAC
MNSDTGNLSSCQESRCLALTFKTLQDHNDVQSNPICDENFTDSQENSEINNEPLNEQTFLKPGSSLQIQTKFHASSKEFNVEHPTSKKLSNAYKRYINKRNLLLIGKKLNDPMMSNPQHRFENSGALNIKESQPTNKEFSVSNIEPTTPTIHERKRSQQDAFETIDNQPSNPRPPFLGQFYQENITSNDNFYLNSSDNELGRQESNYRKYTYHAKGSEGYLDHKYTNTNNSAFPNNYFENEAFLSMSQHRLKETITEHFSQQYQGNRNISESLRETYASQEYLPTLSDPVQSKIAQVACNDRCNLQSSTYPAENIFQREFNSSQSENLKRKMTIFAFQYSSNKAYQALNQQFLKDYELNHSLQKYQNPRLVSENLPDKFNVQNCLSRFTDLRDWRESNPTNTNEIMLAISRERNFEAGRDYFRHMFHNSGERNVPFCMQDLLFQNKTYRGTASENQYKQNFSYTTASKDILTLTTPVGNLNKIKPQPIDVRNSILYQRNEEPWCIMQSLFLRFPPGQFLNIHHMLFKL